MNTELARFNMVEQQIRPWSVLNLNVLEQLSQLDRSLFVPAAYQEVAYSDAEIAAMITKGVRPDGSAMLPPMPYGYLAGMTPDDLAAIILYLRSLPPLPDAD